MSSTTSPNQPGVEGLGSEVVWIFTELSAILVMPTSLLRTVVFFLFKEAYFYADLLPVTPRCASRGKSRLPLQERRCKSVPRPSSPSWLRWSLGSAPGGKALGR